MAIHPGKERQISYPELNEIRLQIKKWVLGEFEVTEQEAISVVSETLSLCPCPAIVGEIPNDYIDRAVRKRIIFIRNNPDKFDNDEGQVEVNHTEPSEPDLEDAYNAADSIAFVGSEKQINWAHSIATKNNEQIAKAWKKKNFKLPTSAKWWIENRDNVYSALLDLK